MFEDRITQLDWRVSRVFRVGTMRIDPMLDVYNLLNSSSILTINTTYGPTWLRPTEVLLGRAFKSRRADRFLTDRSSQPEAPEASPVDASLKGRAEDRWYKLSSPKAPEMPSERA